MSVDDSRLSNRTAVTSRTKHVAAPAPGGRGQGSRKNSVTRCFSVTSSNPLHKKGRSGISTHGTHEILKKILVFSLPDLMIFFKAVRFFAYVLIVERNFPLECEKHQMTKSKIKIVISGTTSK